MYPFFYSDTGTVGQRKIRNLRKVDLAQNKNSILLVPLTGGVTYTGVGTAGGWIAEATGIA